MRKTRFAAALLACVTALPPGGASRAQEEDAPAPGPSIVWRAWTHEVFEVARDLDRPLVVFLTNPWNTLGAVMDANTWTDPRVVGTVRELFVPVRVDADRRPDIDERFSAGGLPSIAILMPSGESMYLKSPRGNYIRAGSGYLTADEMFHYLRSVADYFRDNRQLLDLRIDDIVKRFEREANTTSAPLGAGVVESVLTAMREHFDQTHGGWGLKPKAPDPQALMLCWQQVRAGGNPAARDMGLRTLRALWDSPLHDAVDGGVFRIATERDWSGPRYEKVLEVNAQLLEAMAEGALATGDRWLQEITREQADFILRLYSHPEGGFMRAQGAGDREGSYFKLGRRQRREAQAPPVEPTRIVSWNAHAISGLLRAYQVSGEVRHRDGALAALGFLLERCRVGSRGMWHVYEGGSRLPGLLVDQVAVGRALLDAHQVAGQQRFLREAMELVAVVRAYFRDAASPRYVDRVPDPLASGAMTRPDRDLVDNSELAMLMLDLAALTGSTSEAEEARRILEAYADEVAVYGVYAAPLARAVDRALREPVRLVLAANGQEEAVQALARAAAALPHPRLLVDWLDGRVRALPESDEIILLRGSTGAAALLISGGHRSPVLRAPAEVRQALGAFPPGALPPAPPAAAAPQTAPAEGAAAEGGRRVHPPPRSGEAPPR
jgi:hypothetical protein